MGIIPSKKGEERKVHQEEESNIGQEY
jgi:hypothetical protein